MIFFYFKKIIFKSMHQNNLENKKNIFYLFIKNTGELAFSNADKSYFRYHFKLKKKNTHTQLMSL